MRQRFDRWENEETRSRSQRRALPKATRRNRACEHYTPRFGLDLVKSSLSHVAALGTDNGMAVVGVRRAYIDAERHPRTFWKLPDYLDVNTR